MLTLGIYTACIQIGLGYPFDVIKTNIQIYPTQRYHQIIKTIYSKNGIKGFYRGWYFPFMFSIGSNSLFFGGYHY
jgi:hypothetical protein